MDNNSVLTGSIIKTVGINLAVQWLIYAVLFILHPFSTLRTLLFAVVSLFIHTGTGYLLIKMKDLFRKTDDGTPLSQVNLANILTLFRLFALPTVLFLVIEWDRGSKIGIPLLILMIAAFVTDFFDGMASRRKGMVTEIGRVLDSFADYMSLYVLTISFYLLHIIDLWLFVLVLARGLMVWTGMAILAFRGAEVKVQPSIMGKVSVFAIMTLYAFEIAVFLIPRLEAQTVLVLVVEIIAAVIIAASMVDKVFQFIPASQELSQLRKDDSE